MKHTCKKCAEYMTIATKKELGIAGKGKVLFCPSCNLVEKVA
jgi:RNase P subunit RPR2